MPLEIFIPVFCGKREHVKDLAEGKDRQVRGPRFSSVSSIAVWIGLGEEVELYVREMQTLVFVAMAPDYPAAKLWCTPTSFFVQSLQSKRHAFGLRPTAGHLFGLNSEAQLPPGFFVSLIKSIRDVNR
jgi:hypothetical protein